MARRAARGGRGARHVRRADRLFGLGDARHLRPLVTADGPVLWPIDRATIALVWSDEGYPARGAYRDYHRHTTHHHHAWRNDGGAYDHERALGAGARATPRDFVARGRAQRVRRRRGVRVRAGHRAARALVVRGRHVAGRGGRGGGAPGACADARSTTRCERHEPAPGAGAARREQLGRRGGPANVVRAAGRRAGVARRGRPSCGCSPLGRPAAASARCASCWRCSRATGRSCVTRELGGRLSARAGARPRRRARAPRSTARSPAARNPARCANLAPELAGWGRLTGAVTPSGTSAAPRACG